MRNPTRIVRGLVVGVALIAFAALAASVHAEQRRTAAVDVKMINACQTAHNTLPMIAKALGLYPATLNVSIQCTGPVGLNLIATGGAQFGEVSSPNPELAAAGGAPILDLADWRNPPDFQLIGGPDTTNVASLKGKAVGILQPGGSAAILMNWALNTVGKLQTGDFRAITLGTFPNTIAAFRSGQISALIASPPTTGTLLSTVPGSKVLYDFNTSKLINWPSSNFFGNATWVRSHPAATVAVLKALKDALVAARQPANKAVVLSTIQANTPGLSDPAALEAAYQSLLKDKLSPISLKTMQFVLRVLRENGFDQAKASLAPKITAPVYVQRALNAK